MTYFLLLGQGFYTDDLTDEVREMGARTLDAAMAEANKYIFDKYRWEVALPHRMALVQLVGEFDYDAIEKRIALQKRLDHFEGNPDEEREEYERLKKKFEPGK